jgi:hypothetical protein
MAEPTFPNYGLPELRGAAAGESRIDPTLRPYLGMGLQRAEQLFFGQQPEFFPGQTYVSPSEQTLAALQQQEALARGAQPALSASQEAYMGGLRQLGETASGAFLSGSPYLQSLIETATRPITQQFQEQTLPSIASQYSAAGRYGSGAMARTTGQAQEGASRAIGDVATQLAAADYARERQAQQQAIGAQIDAARLAPQFYQQQFLPSQQLGQIGAAREQIAAPTFARGNGSLPVWSAGSLSAIAGLLVLCLRYAFRLPLSSRTSHRPRQIGLVRH